LQDTINTALLQRSVFWKIYLINLDNKQIKVGKKDEVIAAHALKAYKGFGGIAPLILNLGTSRR
jgi:hypothetical protein